MQQGQHYLEKVMYHDHLYPAHGVHELQSSEDLTQSSWSSHWPSHPAQHANSSSYYELCPCSSPQGPSFNRSHDISRPALLSWPIECFITNNPSHAKTDSELVQNAFNPSPATDTPELLHTPSSIDESANVFDIQFGQSLQASPHLEPKFVNDSPTSSLHYHDIRAASPSSADSATPSPAPADYRRRFPCLLPGCERRFTSRYTLKVHMEAHKPKPKVSFPCTQGCSERFSRQHDRLRHEVAKHGKVCEFLCDDCGRFFSTKKTLGNHKCPVAIGGTRWVHNN